MSLVSTHGQDGPPGPRRRALVVEGGGFRGAFAVGVLRTILEQFGPASFHGIYAVSSGVFAASFFVADQGAAMEHSWRNLVHGRLLMNYWNACLGQPVLRLDYLIGLLKQSVRLDLERVRASEVSLMFVLTDCETGEAAYFDARNEHIFDLMRASSALPYVYPTPVIVEGRRYHDGGQSDGLPVRRCAESGYDDILVVRTRPSGYTKPPRSALLGYHLFRDAPRARHGWLTQHVRYNDAVRFAANPPAGVTIHSIHPPRLLVGRFTRSQRRITAAIEQGIDAAAAYLDTPDSILRGVPPRTQSTRGTERLRSDGRAGEKVAET